MISVEAQRGEAEGRRAGEPAERAQGRHRARVFQAHGTGRDRLVLADLVFPLQAHAGSQESFVDGIFQEADPLVRVSGLYAGAACEHNPRMK